MTGVEQRALIGSLVCVGFRGAGPYASPSPPLDGKAGLAVDQSQAFDEDMSRCAEARVGGVILFDVEVGAYRRLLAGGMGDDEARAAAARNVLSPSQLRELTSEVRRRLGPRVLVSIDQEGGRVARLNARRGFEASLSAAEFALQSPASRCESAQYEALRLSALGIDLNYAPCVDVAVNPDGPVIARLGRSFGADAKTVFECAECILAAHRNHGIAACIKHFPGHGSAGEDSHFGLPDITYVFDEERELGVFRTLIERCNPPMLMAGHLLHRGFDAEFPASLSRALLTTLLREKLGFRGVIATDSLDMRAIADRYSLDETVSLALNAGVDMLLYGYNPAERFPACPAIEIVEAVERGVSDGQISGGMARIAESAARLDRLRRPA